MLKGILLASAVMISAPAFSQDAPAQAVPSTQAQPASPADAATPAEPAAPADAATDKATAEPAAPAEQPDQTAQAAPAKQPATAEQIATIVDQGFPTYDKDADGDLKAEEFGQWMVALRSASEPAFTGQSAADKEWIGKALTTADADKSGTINKEELKGFLAPQAS